MVRVVDTELLGRIEPGLKGGGGRHDLEGRPRRVLALGRAVQKRVLGAVVQLIHRGLLALGIDDLVRVEGRNADRRQHRPAPRIEGDDGPAPSTKGFDRGFLDLLVDPEHHRTRGLALAQVPCAPDRYRVGGVLADQRFGVRRLDARQSELKRRVAHDLREALILVRAHKAARALLARR